MRVAILGLGQIGGSVGRALVAAGDPWRVAGWTRSDDARRAATADGIETKASIGDACAGADLIVLAAPPLACLELLDALAGPLQASLEPGAVITDVASTKVAICTRAWAHGLRFVGGHPMAGREATGYGAADSGLFVGRPWVFTVPDPAEADLDPGAEERVVDLATACGADVVRLDPAEHDAAVAAISHLPLVVAAALVEAIASGPDWPVAERLAAGGWASMTRLARGDVEMGAGILATNGLPVAARLRDLRDVLDGWLAQLETTPADPSQLRERLVSARRQLGVDDPGAAE
jgi:prephenate dehydrogenase